MPASGLNGAPPDAAASSTGWFGYDADRMRTRRVRGAVAALAAFCSMLASGLVMDRTDGYRAAVLRWDMATAFLYTLPTIGLALATFATGWRLRLLQSEALARYRVTAAGLERRREDEVPECIPWARIAAVEENAVRLVDGDRLPLYLDLLAPDDRRRILDALSVSRVQRADSGPRT